MTRQRKTPGQRAKEQLEVAVRKVERLTKEQQRLREQLSRVEEERQAEVERRDYYAQHPDLDGEAAAAQVAAAE